MKALKLPTFILLIFLTLLACKNAAVVPGLHNGRVLAATCSITIQVAVQLDNADPLSLDWKNPANDSIYHHVVFPFDKTLHSAIGKNFTYLDVRNWKDTDPYPLTPAICLSYPVVVLDSVTVKN